MRYMLLIHEPVGQRAQRSPDEGRAAYAAMQAWAGSLQSRGELIAAESLAGTERATRVQRREAGVSLVDGPFAEAKEMVGGFFLVDVPDREAALALAAQCPAAAWCTVEVRALAPCYD